MLARPLFVVGALVALIGCEPLQVGGDGGTQGDALSGGPADASATPDGSDRGPADGEVPDAVPPDALPADAELVHDCDDDLDCSASWACEVGPEGARRCAEGPPGVHLVFESVRVSFPGAEAVEEPLADLLNAEFEAGATTGVWFGGLDPEGTRTGYIVHGRWQGDTVRQRADRPLTPVAFFDLEGPCDSGVCVEMQSPNGPVFQLDQTDAPCPYAPLGGGHSTVLTGDLRRMEAEVYGRITEDAARAIAIEWRGAPATLYDVLAELSVSLDGHCDASPLPNCWIFGVRSTLSPAPLQGDPGDSTEPVEPAPIEACAE